VNYRMSFRRQRDDWDEFIRKHADELRLCGIPSEVFSNRRRFLIFLDHGFDEWGWVENPHGYVFNCRELTDDQVRWLAKLVGEHVDQNYGRKIADDWMRQR